MVESAEQMVGLMADGGNDRSVRGGGIKHHKGVVVFDLIAFINGFSKSGKIAILFKCGCFADKYGRIFSICRLFSDENDV